MIQSQDDIWFLGGKIDGILEDKTIIEVKNRMRGLFNTVREYEKIQTFAYMFILHSQKSQLVETYFNGSRQECGILEVEFEDKFMDYLDSSCSDIMANIKTSGELSDDDKNSLKDKIEGFLKGF